VGPKTLSVVKQAPLYVMCNPDVGSLPLPVLPALQSSILATETQKPALPHSCLPTP
jgi:hypothetical protein